MSSRLVTESSSTRHHLLPFLPFFLFSNEKHHHQLHCATTMPSNPFSPFFPSPSSSYPTENNSPHATNRKQLTSWKLGENCKKVTWFRESLSIRSSSTWFRDLVAWTKITHEVG
ncbi:hypothetical protein AAZV13_15G151300 [Glycine max]